MISDGDGPYEDDEIYVPTPAEVEAGLVGRRRATSRAQESSDAPGEVRKGPVVRISDRVGNRTWYRVEEEEE